jgi:hypothetical protein
VNERRCLRHIVSLATVASLVVAALAIAGAAPGCYGATEVQVQVTTNVSCSPGTALTTQIFTGATGTSDFGTAPAAETDRCEPNEPRVGTLTVVPSAARDDRFDLEVVGAVGVQPANCRAIMLAAASAASGGVPKTTGCIVARRRVSFRPHKSLPLPILLDRSCIGVACGVDQTCDVGVCVATSQCDDTGCPRERVAAPPPPPDADASMAMDGGSDAAAAADATDAMDATDATVPSCGAIPEVVVSGQAIAGQLAVEGSDFVYLNRPGAGFVDEVRRVPRQGGPPVTVVAVPAGLEAVTAAPGAMAWFEQANAAGAHSLTVKTGAGTATASTLIATSAIAFAHGRVVGFSTTGTDAFEYRPDAAVAGFATAATTSAGYITEIVNDEDDNYYGVSGTSVVLRYVDGAVTPTERGRMQLTTAQGDIAVAHRTLYVAMALAGQEGIHQIATGSIVATAFYISSGAWVPLPSASGNLPQSMAADGTNLYYLVGRTLSRAPLAAPSPAPTTVVGMTGVNADRLFVDAECVYWVENGSMIMKRSK